MNLFMGSLGTQNPWALNSSSSPIDCSRGGCSFDCPQFCYLFFSPPPPPPSDDSAAGITPLIVVVIGVLVSGSLLIGYYALVTKFSRRTPSPENPTTADESASDPWAAGAGLDESFIKRITVCKYQKGNGLIEGTDCAVCLSEFEENESLRLMPNCSHAFHIPCIDTWLKSQSNCPLCRTNVAIVILPSPAPPVPQASSAVDANPYEFRGSDDLILAVDQDTSLQQLLVVAHGEESGTSDHEHNRDGVLISCTVSSGHPEIRNLEEISEYGGGESHRFRSGSSEFPLMMSSDAAKRADKFMDKGKHTSIPC